MRRTIEQFLAIFNSLAPSQRVTFALVALVVPICFAWFAWGGSSSLVPLSYGKVFALEDMRNAEQALKEAGLSSFRSEGRQILAPATEVEKYNAVLLQSGSLPSHWAEELEKKMEGTNALMVSSETLKLTKEALLGKHLRRMITASPDFEDAEVIWAPSNSGRSRFSKDAHVKATVFVKPRAGREISLRQVQALRDAVTSAIPDLKASDVTIYDQKKGESYTPEAENDPLGTKTLAILRDYTHLFEKRIRDNLMQISPDVLVAVNVDIDPQQRSITQSFKFDNKKGVDQQKTEQKRNERYKQAPVAAEPGSTANQARALKASPGTSQDRTVEESTTSTTRNVPYENTYTEHVPVLPKLVSVAVSLPEDYFAKALAQSQAAAPATPGKAGAQPKTIEKIKEETLATVKDLVTAAIPSAADESGEKPPKITVNSYVPVRDAAPEIKPDTMETVTQLLNQWGGAVGLGLFTLWALWMVRGMSPRSARDETPLTGSVNVPATPAGGAPIAPGGLAAAELLPEQPLEVDTAAKLNDRDIVQNMARDNPEMAAAIIGKWLQAAR